MELKNETCATCKHFTQHYVQGPGGAFTPAHYGHCVKPRLKTRQGERKACQHWEARPPEAQTEPGLNEFAARRALTPRRCESCRFFALHYILGMSRRMEALSQGFCQKREQQRDAAAEACGEYAGRAAGAI